MSSATLSIADTALEAPGHPQGDGRGGGQRSARLSPRTRARERQHGAPDRDKCDLCDRTQVDNGGPHIYGHCANAWLGEARRTRRIRTDEAIRNHGDAGLWAHIIWRDVWDEDTLVDPSPATALQPTTPATSPRA